MSDATLATDDQTVIGHYIDEMAAAALAEASVAALAEWSARWLYGNGTGSITGLLGLAPQDQPPTPIQRALDILAPHLARCPLYQPSPPPWQLSTPQS